MDGEKSGPTLDEAVSQLIDSIKERNLEDPHFVQVAIALEIEKDNSFSSLLFLALTGDDNEIKVFDLEKGSVKYSKHLSNQIKTIAISDSGSLVFATAQREDTIIWDISEDNIIYNKQNRVTNYTSADFSNDEQYLSIGTFTGKIIRLNASTGEQVNKWQAKPRQSYGSASSKAIIDLVDNDNTISALTSDGMFETFQ